MALAFKAGGSGQLQQKIHDDEISGEMEGVAGFHCVAIAVVFGF